MHKESYDIMKYFVDNYLDTNKELSILDIGSYDVNGNYKSLFLNKNWTYLGIDIIPGPNVDVISESEYLLGISRQFDVVISGNCLEHVQAPWLWIKEVEKAVKIGGLICIITPFSLGEHKYPVDCWRILPDGYLYLLERHCSFKVLETKINYPEPKTKYRYFHLRPHLNWVLHIIPGYIKKKVLLKIEYQIQDSYAIAQKE